MGLDTGMNLLARVVVGSDIDAGLINASAVLIRNARIEGDETSFRSGGGEEGNWWAGENPHTFGRGGVRYDGVPLRRRSRQIDRRGRRRSALNRGRGVRGCRADARVQAPGGPSSSHDRIRRQSRSGTKLAWKVRAELGARVFICKSVRVSPSSFEQRREWKLHPAIWLLEERGIRVE